MPFLNQLNKYTGSAVWFVLVIAHVYFGVNDNLVATAMAVGVSLLVAMGPAMIYGLQDNDKPVICLAIFWLFSATATLFAPYSEMSDSYLSRGALVFAFLAVSTGGLSILLSVVRQLSSVVRVAVQASLLVLVLVAMVYLLAPHTIVLYLALSVIALIMLFALVTHIGFRARDNEDGLRPVWWPLCISGLVLVLFFFLMPLSATMILYTVGVGLWLQIVLFYHHWLAERQLQQQQYQHTLEYEVQERTLELEVTLRELHEKNAELSRLSSTDALTGTRNRRYFDTRLVAEARRCRREQTPLSLAMIDIDYFKKINDTYGHAVGDACIRHVAAVLKLQSRRSSDDVCRYGGEEFALILPNTDSHGALQLIESMREKLEAFPVQVEGHTISLTFSAGICTGLMDEEEQEVELLRQADQLLYEAKKAGRNCVKAAMMERQHG